jgi:tRNA-Thr(GGU) m(6)t(6)A37 methyltransferase TsaA
MTSGQLGFTPIGLARTPFTDKFGIPRQPGLVDAPGRIVLQPPFDRREAFGGLEGFSHVWLIWVFHDDCLTAGWKPTVRPPRLGGRRTVGVFASRAPYRPNPIGLSAVAQHGLAEDPDECALLVSGIDLLDGTPVLDIKPYVPYADALPDATGGFAQSQPSRRFAVRFSAQAATDVAEQDPDGRRALARLIEQMIAQDPRPGYMDRYPNRRDFAFRLYDCDIRWRLDGDTAIVERCIHKQQHREQQQ